jgi:hypothetical protein
MNQSADKSGKTVDGPQQSKSNRSGGGVFATGLQWQRIKECVLTSKITLLSKSVWGVYTVAQTDPACRKERTTWPQ